MRIEQRSIYTFEELDKEAKKKAIEEYRQVINTDFETERDVITEDMRNTVEDKFGFETISDLRFCWSLGSCQGDGVSFTGLIKGDSKNIDILLNNIYNNEVPRNVRRIISVVGIEFIRTDNMYTHPYTISTMTDTVGSYNGNIDRVQKVMDDIEKRIDQFRIDVCKILENNGYDSMDFYNSDEYIIENIECNETEFLEDGSIY